MYTVKVRDHFMIAHSLPDPVFGPAQNLHGATYVVDAEFGTQNLNEQSVVIDIGLAHDALREVTLKLNYKNLDELEAFAGRLTTTEHIAYYVHQQLASRLRGKFQGTLTVTLGESHIAWASYSGPVK